MLRGLVMMLMVVDHARNMYFGFSPNPMNLEETWGALYITRWITHLCAPVFVFLAGTSAFFYGRKRDTKDLRRFLLTRGLWLIFLEITLVRIAWTFNLSTWLGMQVIWALGASMVLLGIAAPLGPKKILGLGLGIIFLHNGLSMLPIESTLWNVLMSRGKWQLGGLTFTHYYALIPWFGVMAAGFGFGFLYSSFDRQGQEKLCYGTGGAMVGLFILLRGLHLYGDPNLWISDAGWATGVMSFFKVAKYPPSLHFVLITLGLTIGTLPLYKYLSKNKIGWLLLTYGRVPLFFYIAHLFLLRLGVTLINPAEPHKFGIGFSLPAAWGVAVVCLIVLTPMSYYYGRYKRNHQHWWLSYL